MKEQWTLREVGRESVDALALIGSATFLETFADVLDGAAIIKHCQAAHSAKAYDTCLAAGGRAWLAQVAQGGGPVGFALIGTPDLPGAVAGDIELKRIYTLSRWHGSGLGTAILDQVLQASAEAERLILGVYSRNDRAIAFYIKQGFEIIGTRQFNVGGRLYDDHVLAKKLNSITTRVN